MTLELPEELTIARAVELKAQLLSAMEGGEALELSGRAVSEVDVAGLQLLCAARRTALARGSMVAFAAGSRSAALVLAVAAAGFGSGEDDRWLVEESGDA